MPFTSESIQGFNKGVDTTDRSFVVNSDSCITSTLQYRSLQRQQIVELASKGNFETSLTLTQEVRKELEWWIQNLHLSNGKALLALPPQLVITSDASLQGWGASCQGHRTGGPWSNLEKQNHINALNSKRQS